MEELYERFNEIDRRVTHWMAEHGVVLLRISLGTVYFWFGVLKFVPELSPATTLATQTIEELTFGLVVPPPVSIYVLAVWETLIGLGLIAGRFLRVVLFLLAVQMIGTIMPVFFFPQEIFLRVPYAPTLEGQYIIKNIVLISAAIVIGATVRGGKIVSDPGAAEVAEEIEERALDTPREGE